MPASISASISSAVPTVNDPPWSSQRSVLAALEQRYRLGVLVEDGDLVALGEHAAGRSPTRLGRSRRSARTCGFCTAYPISQEPATPLRRDALPHTLLARRRRGEDHPARRLLDHVARRLPDEAVRGPPRPPSARRRGSRVGSSAASTIASTPRRRASVDDRLARPCARAPSRSPPPRPRTPRRPPSRARARAWRPSTLLVRHARVERQRHRDLDHVERLDHRAALALLGLLGREPAGGADDVVVERARRRPARGCCRTRPRAPRCSASAGIVKRFASGLPWRCGRSRRARARRRIQQRRRPRARPSAARAR